MKIAVAQIRPEIGPVEGNVGRHMSLIKLGVRHHADLIVFPELSLTGYEPARAKELSRSADDSCFNRLQLLSDQNKISIGAGFPSQTSALPRITNFLFRPGASRRLYSKRFLHADEKPFFDRGTDCDSTIFERPRVSLAICYELSVPEHARKAFDGGSSTHVVSAAKTARGIEESNTRLSYIAKQQSAIVMLANCLGVQDGAECAGGSAAWGRDGRLLARLDSYSEGLIVVDYDTEAVITDCLENHDPQPKS